LRVLVSGSHIALGRENSTCSVNVVENRCCSDSELATSYDCDRLSITSSSTSDDNSSSDYSVDTDNFRCRNVRCIRAGESVMSTQPKAQTNFVPRRCSRCCDNGITTELFVSRQHMTRHTKEIYDSYYNPKGDRFVPLDRNKLLEGRARRICRQHERERREKERARPDFRHPEYVSCDNLPPKGRGRGVLRLQAAFDHLPTASGEGINGISTATPSVGRSKVLEVWAPQHAAADPGRSRNNYPVPTQPPDGSTLSL